MSSVARIFVSSARIGQGLRFRLCSQRPQQLRMLGSSSGRQGGGGGEHAELKPRTNEEITKWVEEQTKGVMISKRQFY